MEEDIERTLDALVKLRASTVTGGRIVMRYAKSGNIGSHLTAGAGNY